MIAMLLAAGRGERMRPLTDNTAKPLLRAGGQRLIEYHLHALARAGIDTVVINTCWQAQQIVEELGSGERYGLEIQYSHESTALETAGGIVNAIQLLGEQPFLLISADVWGNFQFDRIVLERDAQAHLLLVDNPPHHRQGDFSLDGSLVTFDTGPRYTYSGVGLFRPDVFRGLTPGFRPLREILTKLIDKQTLTASVHSGHWFDIGTPQRLTQLNNFLERERST
jgi:MurNAc alpha-1-phosphate uridylyltransferase